MIDHNHPAVEAASMAPYEGREWMADLQRMHGGQSFREAEKPGLAAALTAALPHLTADDLRNTPAVRELMAEAWMVGKFDGAKVCEADHFHHPAKPCTPNPYKETPNE